MNKKAIQGIAVLAAFCVAAAGLWSVWKANRPEAVAGEKQITVRVIHSDGSTAEFEYQTGLEYLGELLLDEGLISGEDSSFGLFVQTVDGETVDFAKDQSWWKLACNGTDVTNGVDSVVLRDGDEYEWAYTTG